MKYRVSLTFESYRDGMFMQEITVDRQLDADYLQEAIDESVADVYANITAINMSDSALVKALTWRIT